MWLQEKAGECDWWWRRVLSWLSRLRGSFAGKLRKLRDRLSGKRKAKPCSIEVDDESEQVKMMRDQLEDLQRRLRKYQTPEVPCARRVRELDVQFVDMLNAAGLGRDGMLCKSLDALTMAVWDLHDDNTCLRDYAYNNNDTTVVSLHLTLQQLKKASTVY